MILLADSEGPDQTVQADLGFAVCICTKTSFRMEESHLFICNTISVEKKKKKKASLSLGPHKKS